MGPDDTIRSLCVSMGGAWQRTYVIPLLHTFCLPQLSDRFHHHQAGQARPPGTRLQPFWDGGTSDAANFDPPVVTIDLFIIAQRHRLIEGLGLRSHANKSTQSLYNVG